SRRISGGPLALTIPDSNASRHWRTLPSSASTLKCERGTERRTFASDAMSGVTFGPGTSTRNSWMSPRPRSSSSLTSLSFWSAGTSFWKLRTAVSISVLVSAVDMGCGILSPEMDYQHLRYEQDGPVTTITIARPERMNAIGPVTARELVHAWERFRDDDAAL